MHPTHANTIIIIKYRVSGRKKWGSGEGRVKEAWNTSKNYKKANVTKAWGFTGKMTQSDQKRQVPGHQEQGRFNPERHMKPIKSLEQKRPFQLPHREQMTGGETREDPLLPEAPADLPGPAVSKWGTGRLSKGCTDTDCLRKSIYRLLPSKCTLLLKWFLPAPPFQVTLPFSPLLKQGQQHTQEARSLRAFLSLIHSSIKDGAHATYQALFQGFWVYKISALLVCTWGQGKTTLNKWRDKNGAKICKRLESSGSLWEHSRPLRGFFLVNFSI